MVAGLVRDPGGGYERTTEAGVALKGIWGMLAVSVRALVDGVFVVEVLVDGDVSCPAPLPAGMSLRLMLEVGDDGTMS